MPPAPLIAPPCDPVSIFESFRGSYATELLTAAVAHFKVFSLLADEALPPEELRARLKLAPRPYVVLSTALRALGLLAMNDGGQLELTALARRHLVPGADWDVSDYVGLAADSPGVLAMVERLRSNSPTAAQTEKAGQDAAFIYRQGLPSAMEAADSARHLTLALAGRAKNVAPVLAHRVELGQTTHLLDVAGGTGIYAIAMLHQFPKLRATVLDRPEVLRVAAEFAERYGVSDRISLVAGDMFADPLPGDADAILLSNVLHDWDVPECRRLVQKCAAALPSGGQLLVHDVFLNDTLDGPLPIALYSASLFSLTEGRAYSGAEYRSWLQEAGLRAGAVVPTLIHCGVMTARK